MTLPSSDSLRSYTVSIDPTGGCVLHLTSGSIYRHFVLTVVDSLCAATGHRLCNTLFAKTDEWANKTSTEFATIPLTREQAEKILKPDTLDWLDDDE